MLISKKNWRIFFIIDTVFIFDSKDISRPRTPFPDPKDCKVTCPNTSCRRILSMDNPCIHTFKSS